MKKKLLLISLLVFLIFPSLAKAATCGERCYGGDCEPECPYCKIIGNATSGTCIANPTPTPTPRSHACCSNPFDGRTGWRYNPATKKCEAQVGLGTERRPIECSLNEYCIPTASGAGECRPGGEIPTPSPGTTCGWPNLPCCQGGSGQAPYCTVGTPSDTMLASCVCLAYQPTFYCDICGCEGGVSSQRCPNCNISCFNCIKDGNSWTGLGCVQTSSPEKLVGWLLKSLLGVGGGIAFLMMLWASFQILTSSGNPEKLKAGKELLTSAISGLLLIIFSLFLLQLIGVKILQLPGFGNP